MELYILAAIIFVLSVVIVIIESLHHAERKMYAGILASKTYTEYKSAEAIADGTEKSFQNIRSKNTKKAG